MHRDIVVMGASAGGVEALCAAVSGLPEELDAAVFVALHLPADAVSVLPTLLQRRTPLPTHTAADGEPIISGHLYVAPPGQHLVLRPDFMDLTRGAKENGHRPSIDTLFRSAARSFGARVIGVVLSGTLDDGALGLNTIVARGGVSIVQEPVDASFPSMPLAALAAVPDSVLASAHQIGEVIGEMSRPVRLEGMDQMEGDLSLADGGQRSDTETSEQGRHPSVFTCPECHGTLFLTKEGTFTHFRCRVGHAFTAESLLACESEALEAALWTALRALEERNDLMRRMAERATKQRQLSAARRFEERMREGDRNAGLLRDVLLNGDTAREEPA